MTSDQLPTPIQHWSQYFTPISWPQILNNTKRKLPTQVELSGLIIEPPEEIGATFCVFGFDEPPCRVLYLVPATAYHALMMASNLRPPLSQHTYSIKGLENLFQQLQQELRRTNIGRPSYAAYLKLQPRYPAPDGLQEIEFPISDALQWLNQHQQKLHHLDCLNLNLSGVSLNEPQFIKELFDLFDRYPCILPKVCIEITESIALADLGYTRQLMERLQSRGVRIALDDFGAGYTSFSYLRELPANALKIDGSLIRDMLKTPSNTAIVRTIVELAQNLGMHSIAEWVEDGDTLMALRQMGVDYVQGFAISRAIEPPQILKHKNILPLVQNPLTASQLSQPMTLC